MPQVDINYLAVLTCGIVYMWCSPLLFGKPLSLILMGIILAVWV